MNNPKPKKPLISKILALVAVVVMLSMLAVTASATGWQNVATDVVTMHPYAPNSITFDGQYQDYNYTLSNTYPVGNTNTQNGNATTIYVNGNPVSLNQVTYVDTATQHLNNSIQNNTTIFPTNTVNRVTVNWGTFAYIPTTLFAEYFDDELVTVTFNTSTYFTVDFKVTYISPTSLETETVTKSTTTTTLSTRPSISYLARSFLDNFVPETDLIVLSMSATITPLATYGGNPSTNVRFNTLDISAPYVTEQTSPRTLVTHFRVSPPSADGSTLFGWLADALDGVLSAPLIPVGNFTITIGSIIGMFIGVTLVIAFLKFFAGG